MKSHIIAVAMASLALAFLFSVALGATCGIASWYGPESGSRTASGARFDPDGLTAASRTLPFGTILAITDMRTGRSVRVRVSDRGPAAWTGRIIDLSRGAARRLGIIEAGTASICLAIQVKTAPGGSGLL